MKKICPLKVLFLIFFLNFFFKTSAQAAFSDKVTSSSNTLQVATLDFSLSSSGNFSPSTLTPSTHSTRTISVVNDGNLSFKYDLSATKTSGNDSFCSKLGLEAKVDGVVKYSGSLLGLNPSSPVSLSGSQDDWDFNVSLTGSDSSFQGKTCGVSFTFSGFQEDSDSSWGFTDEESLTSILTGDDWTKPSSQALDNLDFYYTSDFEVDYQASDGEGVVSKVRLYYSYENGDWQLLYTATPGTSSVSDSFSIDLDDLSGDGEYGFLTVAIDNSGNIENDLDEDGSLEEDELSGLPADTSATIDTNLPVSMLSTPSFTAVANEQLYNGGFENENLDGWTVNSSGSEHQVATDDYKEGNYSALIGFKTNSPSTQPAYDGIKQEVSLSSLFSSTLSFWYHLLTSDLASGGFFEAFVTTGGGDQTTVAHDGWDDPTVFDDDLGWKNITYELSGLEGEQIEIEFRVTQPYEEYKTWAYVDEVKVCSAANQVTTSTDIKLSSHDASGSGTVTTEYEIDNSGSWEEYSLPINLSEGSHKLAYRSTDDAGNIEEEKEINFEVTAEAEVSFGVVLNEILPNPEGSDYAAAPNGEWVELYNNSSGPVNVNGWRLEDSGGNQMMVTATKTEGAGTVITSGGVLRVYRRGSTETSGPAFVMNNNGDTVKLLKPDNSQVDSYRFTFTIGGKSFGRDPDGTGGWKDPLLEVVEKENEEEIDKNEEEVEDNDEVVDEGYPPSQKEERDVEGDQGEGMPEKGEEVGQSEEEISIDQVEAEEESENKEEVEADEVKIEAEELPSFLEENLEPVNKEQEEDKEGEVVEDGQFEEEVEQPPEGKQEQLVGSGETEPERATNQTEEVEDVPLTEEDVGESQPPLSGTQPSEPIQEEALIENSDE